jgi:hypothetical protein
MPTYTTPDDVNLYIEGGTGLDEASLNRYIDRAERDVDGVLVQFAQLPTAALKLSDPAVLDGGNADGPRAAALGRAVCAQVEYRLHLGEEFFIEHQYESTSSPDYSTQGRVPRVGPKVFEELRSGQLLPGRTVGRVRVI